MSDSTSKEERVAAALSRVRGIEATGTNPKCLAIESKIKRKGDERKPVGVSVSYASARRSPVNGIVNIPGEFVEDLSIQEIRHWFIWLGVNAFSPGTSWDQNIHPDCIEDLGLVQANWATRMGDIRGWYKERYSMLWRFIEFDWFGEEEEEEENEECWHHWHPTEAISLDITLDNDGDLEEWSVDKDEPELECCECSTRRSWEDVTGSAYSTIYDLINP